MLTTSLAQDPPLFPISDLDALPLTRVGQEHHEEEQIKLEPARRLEIGQVRSRFCRTPRPLLLVSGGSSSVTERAAANSSRPKPTAAADSSRYSHAPRG